MPLMSAPFDCSCTVFSTAGGSAERETFFSADATSVNETAATATNATFLTRLDMVCSLQACLHAGEDSYAGTLIRTECSTASFSGNPSSSANRRRQIGRASCRERV